MTTKTVFNQRETAKELGISVPTLWRMQTVGAIVPMLYPTFSHVKGQGLKKTGTRPMYRKEDIDRFKASRLATTKQDEARLRDGRRRS